jgi:hypothetical protein
MILYGIQEKDQETRRNHLPGFLVFFLDSVDK